MTISKSDDFGEEKNMGGAYPLSNLLGQLKMALELLIFARMIPFQALKHYWLNKITNEEIKAGKKYLSSRVLWCTESGGVVFNKFLLLLWTFFLHF